MLDPITIGIAFTAAQQSVNYIKKAIALGKDVNSLYGQFAKFFENSDTIHAASIEAQTSKKILTDGQIRAMSVQIAMQSKALRDAEKELKEMLIWSGNKDVWDEMMAERVRMYKERAKLQADIKNARIQAQSDMIDRLLIGTSFMAIAVPVVLFTFAMITADNVHLSAVLSEIPQYLFTLFTILVYGLLISQRCFLSPSTNGLKIDLITNT